MLSANHQNGMDDLILVNGVWPPLIGRSVQVPTTRKHFAFRREFRPLDILQLVFLTCFTFSTEETLLTLVGGPCWCFFCVCFGVGFGFLLVVLVLVFWLDSPVNLLCFLSFYDDLGTPPTWRPHSWKKMVPSSARLTRPTWNTLNLPEAKSCSWI